MWRRCRKAEAHRGGVKAWFAAWASFIMETIYLEECPEGLYIEQRGRGGKGRTTESMSRKDNCLDNAVMEKFFRMLKTELFYLQGFDSPEHFKAELIDFLDYYNNRRIKAKLNGLTPAQHRSQALQTA